MQSSQGYSTMHYCEPSFKRHSHYQRCEIIPPQWYCVCHVAMPNKTWSDYTTDLRGNVATIMIVRHTYVCEEHVDGMWVVKATHSSLSTSYVCVMWPLYCYERLSSPVQLYTYVFWKLSIHCNHIYMLWLKQHSIIMFACTELHVYCLCNMCSLNSCTADVKGHCSLPS